MHRPSVSLRFLFRASLRVFVLIGALALIDDGVIGQLVAQSPSDIPAPRDHFGHEMGADRKLIQWAPLLDYYRLVAERSDRVLLREIGASTLGRPMVVLEISSSANLAKRERLMELQRRLATGDVSKSEEDALVEESRFVVYMNNNMHSTEIASSVMVPELLHRLATDDDPHTRELLDNCVLVCAPSANPDGIDKIVDWYERYLDTPWEGGRLPWLYQAYVGHDNNRDWFMLSQKETRNVSRVLYEEWFPAVVYDVHQMGSRGARYFVPPFTDPVNPNLSPLVLRGMASFGTAMTQALEREDKAGVIQSITFDNWWNGGARNVPSRHNMVGILSEAASCRIATPIYQQVADLRGHGHGLPRYGPQTKFPNPWRGGWWRLRDIVDYELISTDAILTRGARYRREVNRDFLRMARRNIARGQDEAPYAFVIPAGQRDRAAVRRLVENLIDTAVEVRRATSDFTLGGETFAAGSFVVSCAQAFRGHLKDLLERQHYPEVRASRGGAVIRPYDNAGWTLPLQFGIRCVTATSPIDAETKPVTKRELEVEAKRSSWPAGEALVVDNRSNDAFTLVNRLLAKGIAVSRIGLGDDEAGKFLLRRSDLGDDAAKALDDLTVDITTAADVVRPAEALRKVRVGIYRPWTASMDEGWTRFVLEQHDFNVTPLDTPTMRFSNLAAKFDAVVVASITPRSLRNGGSRTRYPPPYQGGLGGEGRANLQRFVDAGGTMLFFGASTPYANDVFELGLVDARDARMDGLSDADRARRRAFVCPGSILRAKFDKETAKFAGIDETWPVFYRGSIFYTGPSAGARGWFDGPNPLESGYLSQPDVIAGRAALIDRRVAKGRVVLYCFRPQNRAQSLGTFRLMFRVLHDAGMN